MAFLEERPSSKYISWICCLKMSTSYCMLYSMLLSMWIEKDLILEVIFTLQGAWSWWETSTRITKCFSHEASFSKERLLVSIISYQHFGHACQLSSSSSFTSSSSIFFRPYHSIFLAWCLCWMHYLLVFVLLALLYFPLMLERSAILKTSCINFDRLMAVPTSQNLIWILNLLHAHDASYVQCWKEVSYVRFSCLCADEDQIVATTLIPKLLINLFGEGCLSFLYIKYILLDPLNGGTVR